MKFGEIYTNGINYWMVTGVWQSDGCPHCGKGFVLDYQLQPVVLDEHGNPQYLTGYYNGKLQDIKPYAKFYMRCDYGK